MKINAAYLPAIKSEKRYLVLYGGAGSGKSVAMAQKIVLRLTSEKNQKILVLRKVAATLKNSVFDLIKSQVYAEELQAGFEFKVSPLEIIYMNGNKVIFLGLDDPEKIKSIQGITSIWIEETTELESMDFNQIDLRLRGETAGYKQIGMTFNPIDEEHWLKDRIDRMGDSADVYITTYKDNAFIDEDYKKTLEGLVTEDENLHNIYARGLWGRINVEGRVYKKYDNILNAADWKYRAELPLVVCVDFNVNPMKWALVQHAGGNDYVFDEVVLNDTYTEEMCAELLKRYGKRDYTFYGDYSGTFRSTSSRSTDYEIIKTVIPSATISTKPNPAVIDRVNAMNWRLCNDLGIRRLFVNKNCTHTDKDLSRVKWKDGRREIDKATLDLTHISDAIGYYVETEYSLKGKAKVHIR